MNADMNVRTLAALIADELEAGLVCELVGHWNEVNLPGYHRVPVSSWDSIEVLEDGAARVGAFPVEFGPFEADSQSPIDGVGLFAPGGRRPLRIVQMQPEDRRPIAAGETLTLRIRLTLEVVDE